MNAVAPSVGDVPAARSPWRAVALPTEHGGWGLTFEPVLLGLLVAWRASGVAIGVAAMLAFVARTPLKVVLVDRHRGRSLERTRLAARVFAVEGFLLGACLAAAAATAKGPFWIPLLAAVPLLAVELWFDMRSRSRRLLPELAGTIGIGAVGASIVLAADGSRSLAAGVWVVIAARAIASIPFVRHQLARAKHQVSALRLVVGAQAAGLGLVAIAWWRGWLPLAAVLGVAALGAVQLALTRRPPPRAAVVGVQQLAFGLAIVAVTAIGAASVAA